MPRPSPATLSSSAQAALSSLDMWALRHSDDSAYTWQQRMKSEAVLMDISAATAEGRTIFPSVELSDGPSSCRYLRSHSANKYVQSRSCGTGARKLDVPDRLRVTRKVAAVFRLFALILDVLCLQPDTLSRLVAGRKYAEYTAFLRSDADVRPLLPLPGTWIR